MATPAELEILDSLARVLSDSVDLDEVLGHVLRTLSDGFGLARVALSLVDGKQKQIVILAGHGLTPAEVDRGRYGYGEGLIGRVAVTGEVAVVPSISKEPRFVDKTGARAGADRSFVCVPIVVDGKILGALSAYRPVSKLSVLLADCQLLSIVGSMIAAHVLQHMDRLAGDAPQSRIDQRSFQPPNMIGRSKAIRETWDLVGQVAPSHTTVLLRGESGTGKELVASAIHGHSPRSRKAFVKVNCAALAEGVIESELFGHERGAFTGALQQRKGRFELANGGTIFLDEIGDLSPQTQIKLLRVLQEREFERVGGTLTVRVDVRVIAATSRDLEAMMDEGLFRKDLYYRLNVYPIRLPALRERRADILLLADHFVDLFNRAHGKYVRRISTPAIDMLMAYHWPGNVRELENCMERALLLARDDVIGGHHLPPTLQTAEATDTSTETGLKAALDLLERELLLEALKTSRGNMAKAARSLQISERIMGLRIAKHQLEPKRFRKATKT